MAFQAYPYNGNLRSNEIFSSIYNMIISQQVFADNLKHNYSLVDEFKTDGSMYGDTKLYYATDVLSSAPWLNDSEASNLLALARPKDPACQAGGQKEKKRKEIGGNGNLKPTANCGGD